MSKKFKSFEEFGKTIKQERSQGLQEQIDGIFEKSIKNDFDSIPEGPFKSILPEINWIAFVHTINKETGERKGSGSINAVISSKTESGTDKTHTWSVNKNGIINPIQKIPLELVTKYGQEEIAFEIASLLERIGPSFIHLTDLEVIPLQDEGESREITPGPKGSPAERPIDPEREKFLQSQRGARFEFANRSIGFKGYKGLLFDKFIYLENPYRDNAAFIIDLPEQIDFEAIEQELTMKRADASDSGEISKDDVREAVLERYWKPISEKAKTRKELVALGAQRFIHTPETWQENISKAIAERAK